MGERATREDAGGDEGEVEGVGRGGLLSALSSGISGALSSISGATQRGDSAFVNTLSKLGSSRDRTAIVNTEFNAEPLLSDAQLSLLYRQNQYAAKLVDLPPEEATRKGFEVKVSGGDGGEDAGAAFEDEIRRLDLITKCRQADIWARLYGGGAVVLGVEDGRAPSEPVDLEALLGGREIGERVSFAYTLDRYSLYPVTGDFETDPRRPGFGKPARYRMQFRDRIPGATLQELEDKSSQSMGYGDVIHASRMLRFFGVELPPELASEQDYWGDPAIQRNLESVLNLTNADRAAGNILQTFVQSIFRMKGLRSLLGKEGAKEALLDRFLAMNLSQSILSMIVIDEGEDYERRSTNIAGFDSLHDRVSQSYAAGMDVGITRALNINPGGLGNNDEGTARNLESMVAAYQQNRYVPVLRYACQLLAATREGPTMGRGARLEIVPRPLRELTEQEQASTDKTRAEAAALLIDRGVYTAREVRRSEPLQAVQIERDREAGVPGGEAGGDPGDPDDPAASLDALLGDDYVRLTADRLDAEGGFKPPKGVARAAARGLELRTEYGRGGTRTGIARARDLSNRAEVSEDTIRRMVAFFARHEQNKDTPPEDGNGMIAWLLWGGDAGRRWAERVLEQIERREDAARRRAGDYAEVIFLRDHILEPRVDKDPPADPEEQISGSSKNAKGSASSAGGDIDLDATIESALKAKLEEHNNAHGTASKRATLGALKAVWRRGAGAFSKSHRKGMQRSQWAMARVNAYLYLLRNGRAENSAYTTDYDLLPSAHPKSTREDAYRTDPYSSWGEVRGPIAELAEREHWTREQRGAFVEAFNAVLANHPGDEGRAHAVAVEMAREAA